MPAQEEATTNDTSPARLPVSMRSNDAYPKITTMHPSIHIAVAVRAACRSSGILSEIPAWTPSCPLRCPADDIKNTNELPSSTTDSTRTRIAA